MLDQKSFLASFLLYLGLLVEKNQTFMTIISEPLKFGGKNPNLCIMYSSKKKKYLTLNNSILFI